MKILVVKATEGDVKCGKCVLSNGYQRERRGILKIGVPWIYCTLKFLFNEAIDRYEE